MTVLYPGAQSRTAVQERITCAVSLPPGRRAPQWKPPVLPQRSADSSCTARFPPRTDRPCVRCRFPLVGLEPWCYDAQAGWSPWRGGSARPAALAAGERREGAAHERDEG